MEDPLSFSYSPLSRVAARNPRRTTKPVFPSSPPKYRWILDKAVSACREQPRHHLPRLCGTVSMRDEAAICEIPRIKGEWPAFARFNVRWNGTRLPDFREKRIERFRKFRDGLRGFACISLFSIFFFLDKRAAGFYASCLVKFMCTMRCVVMIN